MNKVLFLAALIAASELCLAHGPQRYEIENTEATRTAMELAEAVGGEAYVVADTRSMEPTLTSDHVIIIQPVADHMIHKGDIVVFERWVPIGITKWRMRLDQLVCHRVVAVRSRTLATKGDSVRYRDPESVKPHHVRGRVLFAVDRRNGEILDFRFTRNGEPIDLVGALASLGTVQAIQSGVALRAL